MNEYFLKKAYENEPKLIHTQVPAKQCGKLVEADNYWGYDFEPMPMPTQLKNGSSFCLDFGDHYTGRLSFTLGYVSYPDAPVQVHIKFAETLQELAADFTTIETGLCRSWLQQETVYIDFPRRVDLPRRYAFRYIQVTVEATPQLVTLSDFLVKTESCADIASVPPLNSDDEQLVVLDRIGVKTTAECMQRVFEDGPKRDRRLWLGDLRIEALVNYYTFKNMDIVKKCLYLFAASAVPGERMTAAIFENDETALETPGHLLDYALFFGVSLNEYHMYSGDCETTDELFDIAHDQFLTVEKELDQRDLLVQNPCEWWCFIDHVNQKKSAAAQAIFIYSCEHMRQLCRRTGREAEEAYYEKLIGRLRRAAVKYLYDEKNNVFLSDVGAEKLSVHTQIWMILADAVTGEKAKQLLGRTMADKDMIQPVSPYMHHFVLEAMMHLGMKEEARAFIMGYWGKMAELGADTYWEVYLPGDRVQTTYGNEGTDPSITSYCHGWSCSVTYFTRKYFAQDA